MNINSSPLRHKYITGSPQNVIAPLLNFVAFSESIVIRIIAPIDIMNIIDYYFAITIITNEFI